MALKAPSYISIIIISSSGSCSNNFSVSSKATGSNNS